LFACNNKPLFHSVGLVRASSGMLAKGGGGGGGGGRALVYQVQFFQAREFARLHALQQLLHTARRVHQAAASKAKQQHQKQASQRYRQIFIFQPLPAQSNLLAIKPAHPAHMNRSTTNIRFSQDVAQRADARDKCAFYSHAVVTQRSTSCFLLALPPIAAGCEF